MTADVVRKKDVILNLDVTRQSSAIGKNVVVAHDAVVRDVHTHHEKVARADASCLRLAARPMERTEFTNQIVVADDQAARFAFELHVLRLASEYGVLKDTVSCSKLSKAFDNRVRTDFASCCDFDIIFDNDIRANANAGRDQSPGTDYRC